MRSSYDSTATLAGNLLDGDESVENLRHLLFEGPLEELGRRPREDDAGLVVVHLDRLDDRLNRVALAVVVVRDLLGLGQQEFVLLVVEDEHLLFPNLVDLARDEFADLLRVFAVKVGLFELQNARGEVLAQRQHRAAAERGELHLVGVFVADFVGGVDRLDLRDCDLHVGVLDGAVLDDRAVAPDLEVALLGVDDDVEVLVRFELFLQGVAEDVLQHADHGLLVDVLQLFELGKVADQIQVVHGFFVVYFFRLLSGYLKSRYSTVDLISSKG